MNLARRAGRALSLVLAVAGFAGLSVPMGAQTTWGNPNSGNAAQDPVVQRNIENWSFEKKGLPDDWSHHRLIFSDPGTEEEAIRKNTHEHWLKIVDDPRFILQQIKRGKGTAAVEGADASTASTPRAEDALSSVDSARGPGSGRGPGMVGPSPLEKDWSVNMGGAVGAQITADVNSNNATNGSTVVINGASTVTLTANTPTQANATATILTGYATTISGSSTVSVTPAGGSAVTFDASPPTTEVVQISVPNNNYCIPPGAGVTVGTGSTHVVASPTATVPTGGQISITTNVPSGSTTVGGVVYTWETSLGAANCGTTLNCVLTPASNGSQNRDNAVEALYRAINNTGTSTCANTAAVNPCYVLATG
jgi:hypothetical protein